MQSRNLEQTYAQLLSSEKSIVDSIESDDLKLTVALGLLCRRQDPTESATSKKQESSKQTFKNWIISKVPLMAEMYESIQNAEDQRYRLIKGAVQSGKTKAMIAHALIRIHELSRVSVVIVRNITADAKQFEKQCNTFLDEYFNYDLNLDGRPGLRPSCFCMCDYNKSKTDELANLIESGNGIVVCLANGSQLQKLLNVMLFNVGGDLNFDLLIDEVDEIRYRGIGSETDTSFQHFLEEFETGCVQMVGITATALEEVIGNNQLTNKSIFELPSRPNYKGVDDVKKVVLPHGVCPTFLTKRDYFECDTYALNFYLELTDREPFVFKDRQGVFHRHPIICLHKASTLTKHHYQMLATFARHHVFSKKWGVITYNANGITMYHHLLQGKKISVDVSHSRGVNVRYNHATSVFETSSDLNSNTGMYHFKDLSLSDAIQFFKTSVQVERLLIISGNMASRGVNFVSADYAWHLTHLYFLMSKTSTTADLVQACRICGVYDDDIPLTMYGLEQDLNDLNKTLEVQKRFIDEMRKVEEEKQTTVMYSDVPLTKKMLPLKNLCKHHLYKRNLNIVKELDTDSCQNGQYYVVDEHNVKSGTIAHVIVCETIKILIEDASFVFKERSWINKKLLSLSNKNLSNVDTLNGHWNAIRQTHSIQTNDHTTLKGVVMCQLKNKNTWMMKLNL